jgi:hypothetical protein
MALVELGRYSHPEAHFLIAKLESAGVMAFAFDTGASIADSSQFLIPVRVMVDDEDLEAAIGIRDEPAQ